MNKLIIKFDPQLGNLLKHIGEKQEADSKLNNIIQRVKETTVSDGDQLRKLYAWKGGRLYSVTKNGSMLAVPEECIVPITIGIHEYYGHPGVKRTTELLKEFCN